MLSHFMCEVIMRKKRLKPDERRKQILSTAFELFQRQGYEQTSIEQILQVLSLSKGGLYHHFPSRDAIFEALVKEELYERLEKMKEIEEELEPLPRLLDFFRRGSSLLSAKASVFPTLTSELNRERFIRIVEASIEEPLRTMLRRVISDGVRSGAFSLKHPVDALVEMWIAVNHHCNACLFREKWDRKLLISYLYMSFDFLEGALGISGPLLELFEDMKKAIDNHFLNSSDKPNAIDKAVEVESHP